MRLIGKDRQRRCDVEHDRCVATSEVSDRHAPHARAQLRCARRALADRRLRCPNETKQRSATGRRHRRGAIARIGTGRIGARWMRIDRGRCGDRDLHRGVAASSDIDDRAGPDTSAQACDMRRELTTAWRGRPDVLIHPGTTGGSHIRSAIAQVSASGIRVRFVRQDRWR